MFQVSIAEQYSFINRSLTYRNHDPINENQQKILEQFRKNKFGSSFKQAIDFSKENPGLSASILVPNGEDDGMQFLIMSSSLTIPITVAVCIPGGQGVGAAIAGVGVGIWYGKTVYEKVQLIRRSGFYQAWKNTWVSIYKIQMIAQYIVGDDQLQYFICPITKHLPIMPIRFAGSDQVYEGEELIDWIKENPNTIHPYFNKKLSMDDIIIDFAHLHSIVDRLDNLHRKTLAYLDQEAYLYNEAVNFFFERYGNAQLKELRNIVMEYIDLSRVTVLDDQDQFRTRRVREPHPVLLRLTIFFKIFENSIHVQKESLKKQYKEECALSPSCPTVKMVIITECWKNLHQRKIIWKKGENRPLYSEIPKDEFSESLKMANLIAYFPIAVPAYLSYRYGYNKRVLKTIDLTKKLPDDVVEYSPLKTLE